jgi:hypothetical protein
MQPFNLKSFSNRQKIKFKYIPDIKIKCCIEKELLIEIIKKKLVEYFNLSVFGYNNQFDEFWAKKIINDEYLLHFTMIITSSGYEKSNIIISPLVGSDKEINDLILKIIEILKLYDSSFNKNIDK